MKTKCAAIPMAMMLFALTLAADIPGEVAAATDGTWLSWEVPATQSLGLELCCGRGSRDACRVGEWESTNIRSDRPGTAAFDVYMKVANRRPAEIHMYGTECGVDEGTAKVRRIAATPAETVEYFDGIASSGGELGERALRMVAFTAEPSAASRLENQLRTNASDDIRSDSGFFLSLIQRSGALPVLDERLEAERSTEVRERLIFAISQIDGDGASGLLQRAARQDREPDVREQALFWLSQTRGLDALPLIRQVVDSDPSEDVREHGVFAISQIDHQDATRTLAALARDHRDPEIRKIALFWLAQRASGNVARLIEDSLDSEEDEDVLEAAVFAVTQLSSDEKIPLLIRLAERHPSRAVREKAIFWLGQSSDRRAQQVLEQLALGITD